MKNKILNLSVVFLSLIFSLAFLQETKAQKPSDNLKSFAEGTAGIGYSTTEMTPTAYIGYILSILYGFLGVIALILIVYAGFKWMMAQGSDAEIKKAQQIISSAVMGLAILFGAYVITSFIISQLQG